MTTEALPGLNIGEPEFWRLPLEDRHAAFAQLRAEGGVHFFPEPELPQFDPGPGYYAVTTYDLVQEVSCHPELYCSGKGISIGDVSEEIAEFFGSMISTDDPRHARLRRIVGRAFSPRMLESFRQKVAEAADEIIGGVADRGECDFVTDIAAKIPLRVIVDMMGIPRSHEQFIFDGTNKILGALDPEYIPRTDDVMATVYKTSEAMVELAADIARDRIKDPQDDLISALVTAEVDGEKLSAIELGSFFILLVIAGNETTRNTIAWGLDALEQHPDQRAAWQGDYDRLMPTAVEELVRWSTPVIHFRRTVTRDGVRLADHTFNEGDKVVIFYTSANRDEAAFEKADRFDIGRDPNPHLGFGAPGPHYCLGFHLARREIGVTFSEVFRRLPDIHCTGGPDRLYSNFINGVKHLPVAWTPGLGTAG
jgi:methyl-branched lipid omega-hydroxylase